MLPIIIIIIIIIIIKNKKSKYFLVFIYSLERGGLFISHTPNNYIEKSLNNKSKRFQIQNLRALALENANAKSKGNLEF